MLAAALFGSAISAGVGTAVAVGTSQIVAAQATSFFINSFGTSFALGVLNQALTPKGLGEPITSNERDPISPRQIIYGTRRVGGTIVAIGTSDWVRRRYESDGQEGFERYLGNNNRFLHSVIAIAGHEITGIDELYFNEVKVSNGATSGDQFPFDVSSDFQNEFDAAPTTGTQRNVVKFRLGTSSQTVIDDLIFDSTNLKPASKTDLNGDPTYPYRYAENYVGPQDDPVSFAGIDSNFKLNDTAYIYFRGFHDNGLYKDGIPKLTVKVRGKAIYDPRTGATAIDSQLDNPALIIRDYLLDTKFGLGVASDEIDEDGFEAAADACDALVSDGDGGTQKRYTMSAVFNSENTPREVIDKMLTSCGGQLVYTKGKFRLLVGEYRAPSISLNENHLISPIRISTKNSVRQSYNKVQGTFFSQADNYLATDYPVQTDAAFVTADGRESGQILDLPFTMDSATAQRLARLHLVRSRQEATISFDANLNALELTAGDTFQLTNSRIGWTNKIFEVVDARLNINGLSPSVTITAVETSQGVYTAADTGNFIEAIISEDNIYQSELAMQPPENLSVSSVGVLDEDGKVQTKWTITFEESASQNDLLSYEIQWKLSTDSVYDVWDMGTETSLEGVGGVVVGGAYNIRVRAKGKNGQYSNYVTAAHTMAGDTTAPSAPTGFTATGGLELITLDWDSNSELDLRGYYLYENTSNDLATATQIGFVSADLFTRTNLPSSATRYYWVSAVDFSGNESAKSTVASATTDASIASDDTKTASGYVYYQTASSSQPSSPSASSFSFSTLQFSGLSSSWDESPPQISDNADRYWASQYIVEDVDGAQTITFATPFRSFYFDGLVTFTNLNNELADPNSSEITTISGGLIKTGTVDANRIELDGNTIEAGGSGIQIKNLGVSTLKIADNAVTVPDATFSYTPVSITTSSSPQYYVVLELSVVSIANIPNLITFSVHAYTNTKEQFIAGIGVTRSGTDTFLLEFGQLTNNSSNEILPNTTIAGSVIHTPTSSGTDVYKIYLAHNQTGKILRANARSLSRVTIKK